MHASTDHPIRPPPDGCTRSLRLDDGREVRLRPIRRNDASHLRDLAQRMSPQSRYFRFFATMSEPSPELLARLAEVDYERAMALAATFGPLDREQPVGVARYAVLPGERTGEFAIAVADDWHGTGVAGGLMDALLSAAREVHQLEALTGVTLVDNHRMVGLARALGFDTRSDPEDARLVRLSRAL